MDKFRTQGVAMLAADLKNVPLKLPPVENMASSCYSPEPNYQVRYLRVSWTGIELPSYSFDTYLGSLRLQRIDDTLRSRPIDNPHVTFTRGYAGDPANGKPGKVYWRCEVEDDAWIRFSYFYY